jgi:hypothetical protein
MNMSNVHCEYGAIGESDGGPCIRLSNDHDTCAFLPNCGGYPETALDRARINLLVLVAYEGRQGT